MYTRARQANAPKIEDIALPQATSSAQVQKQQTIQTPTLVASSTSQDNANQMDLTQQITSIPGDPANWRTYTDFSNSFSFRYPDGWNIEDVSTKNHFYTRYQLESKDGDTIYISFHKRFSKLMLSRNGDILSYDRWWDAWVSELDSSRIIKNSDLQNTFLMMINGGSKDIYTYDTDLGRLTSENGARVYPTYHTASNYPIYEIDRPNGDNTTYYLITPLPNRNAVYVYYYGTSVLPGLEKIIETILLTSSSLGGFDRYGNPVSGYEVNNLHAYYNKKLIGADPITLEVIKGSLKEMHGYVKYDYAKDANTVYYAGNPLPGAFPATFRPIENSSGSHSYGIDGKTVYSGFDPIPSADPKTFKILWQTIWEGCPYTHYSKDATRVYVSTTTLKAFVVPYADPATFESLVNGFGKDKRGYYEGTTYLGPTIDLNNFNCGVG